MMSYQPQECKLPQKSLLRNTKLYSILCRDVQGKRIQKEGDINTCIGFPSGSSGKEPACQCRRRERCGLSPGLGRFPGGGHGNPLQHSGLENPHE